MQRQSYCILEQLILPSTEQVLLCKRQSHKSLIHRQYATSLYHNFSSNIWWTSNKIQRFADIVSFVLSTWGNTTWNKPDICSARLQVEMCQLLDPLRTWGPSEWQQSNTPMVSLTELQIQMAAAVLHRCEVWPCWINVRNVSTAIGKAKAGDHHVCYVAEILWVCYASPSTQKLYWLWPQMVISADDSLVVDVK